MAKTRLIMRSGNQRVPFKYCSRDIDRHGNERFYLRLPGMPKYRMTSAYLDEAGSITQAFTEEYHRVLAGDRGEKAVPISRLEPGSVRWLSRLLSVQGVAKPVSGHAERQEKRPQSLLR
ncbi:hypothetical protein FHW77_004762 [Agrobacterium sp. RC10-4-1]|uniref:hypothetical protein n=1 Tax=Agrobacterium sp. RC10-4-1 TaxID=2587039 RepID=UPI00179CDE3F|nr:hypothetical protein [Agrobacterium sp. RC10-4-1]MBA8801008.1 hypothetical protein [Agrobacterium sp. RC10-4-1]